MKNAAQDKGFFRLREVFLELRELKEHERGARLRALPAQEAAAVTRLLRFDSMDDDVPSEWNLPLPPLTETRDPRAVGSYKIISRIGSGGMGDVYLAHQDDGLDRKIALKLLRNGWASPEHRARFGVERKALAMLNHSAIARVFDAGTTEDGRPWFAMDYIEHAEPITTHCDRHRLAVRERLRLFRTVCNAVAHAHSRGVIHRDLKPSNVLVHVVDAVAQPKIIDFGIARIEHDEARQTVTGHVLGTPGYMSPEQASSGSIAVDARTDVYSLGVILRELLPPNAGRELSWIVSRASDEDLASRFDSVAALMDSIDRYLAGDVVITASAARWYRLRKLVAKHRILVTAATLAIVGLGTGLVVAADALGESRKQLGRANDLARRQTLERLRNEANSLWPLSAQIKGRIERWIVEASALTQQLDSLRSKASRSARVISDDKSTYQQELASVITALEDFRGQDSDVVIRATLGGMRARLRLLKRADHLSASSDKAKQAWQATIRRTKRSALYRGLSLAPIWGLVPLGPDPMSKLEEFADPLTGKLPDRGDSGVLSIDASTSCVFVLLPGKDDSPPFLMSKYEFTQGQWLRHTGENPSVYGPGSMPKLRITLAHPVTGVSWAQTKTMLRTLGHELPTLRQWQYACAAESTKLYGVGDTGDSLEGYANVCDESRNAYDPRGADSWNDGWIATCPVGSFKPNAFGLHNLHANVAELCLDMDRDARLPFVAGGDWSDHAQRCTVNLWVTAGPHSSNSRKGFRTVRSLHQAP